MSCSRKSSRELCNHYRIVEEKSAKYVPPDGFFGIQILPNSISAGTGSLRRSLKPLSRLGRKTPPPHFPPPSLPSAYRSRRLRRLATVPNHFSKPSVAPEWRTFKVTHQEAAMYEGGVRCLRLRCS